MVAITLPDGSVRRYEGRVSGADIAADIGPGLAKAALAVRVDGTATDLLVPIENDASIGIITSKDEEALDLLRHDCAHVMAEAVKELYPKTQVTIGPSIENGFYYDFHMDPITDEDLRAIEKRMKALVKANLQVQREEHDNATLRSMFADNPFKIEIMDD